MPTSHINIYIWYDLETSRLIPKLASLVYTTIDSLQKFLFTPFIISYSDIFILSKNIYEYMKIKSNVKLSKQTISKK